MTSIPKCKPSCPQSWTVGIKNLSPNHLLAYLSFDRNPKRNSLEKSYYPGFQQRQFGGACLYVYCIVCLVPIHRSEEDVRSPSIVIDGCEQPYGC